MPVTTTNTNVQVGQAAFFGLDGTVSGVASVVFNSAEVTDEFDVTELKDGFGNTIGAVSHNGRKSVSFEMVPLDGGTAALPAQLAAITTSDFALGDLNGTWYYVGGGKISMSNEGFAKFSLPCKRWSGVVATP